MGARPTPFDLVLAPLAEERFPAVRAGLEAAGADPADRDAFLMENEVVRLVHDLRPDDGLGEGIAELAALVHHGYLFWAAGRRVVALDRPGLEALLDAPAPAGAAGAARYVQVPPHAVWAEPVPAAPAEPLDGFFVHPSSAGLRALAVFGLHPDRLGFTVAEVEGPRPGELVRPDGTPLFSAALPGGARAGLHSLAGAEELLEFAWRTGVRA